MYHNSATGLVGWYIYLLSRPYSTLASYYVVSMESEVGKEVGNFNLALGLFRWQQCPKSSKSLNRSRRFERADNNCQIYEFVEI